MSAPLPVPLPAGSAGDRRCRRRVGVSPAAPVLRLDCGVPPAAWDDFVERHPDATVYHLAAWTDLIADAFGHRTARIAAIDSHGTGPDRIAGVLPLVLFKTRLFGRFAVSMPFVNYGGIAAESDAAAQVLYAGAVTAAQKADSAYLELRHARRLLATAPSLTHKVAMILPLRKTVDEQWTGLDRKLRNQVRKAEKSGLTVSVGGVELAGRFHDVLAENMRDLGSPVHGRAFFERILETFPDRSRVLVVSLGDRPIAASLLLWHRQRLEVPWASSIRRFNRCARTLLYGRCSSSASSGSHQLRLRTVDATKVRSVQAAVGARAAAAVGSMAHQGVARPIAAPQPEVQRAIALAATAGGGDPAAWAQVIRTFPESLP